MGSGGPAVFPNIAKSKKKKEYGYDPKIASETDAAWTEESLLLGFNARSSAIEK
jgi:hypothetical protein